LTNNSVERTGASPDCPRRGINFVIPILFLVGLIFLMLIITGGWPGVSMAEAIGEGSSSKALVWGSFGAVFLTIVLYSVQRLATIQKLFKGYMEGMMSIFVGTIILVFAWGIGGAIKEVGTASYIVSIAGDVLSPAWIPVITFITGAVVSFCTGTSYGTMGILMPIVVPLVYKVSQGAGVDHMAFIIPTIGAVFAGAVWGDHCSPISDTTIMSSMFSGADHMDHVNTQIPYALIAASGALVGYVGVAMGLPVVADLIIATLFSCTLFRLISSPIEA
jgi:Na+/H+ antiporter NhaC